MVNHLESLFRALELAHGSSPLVVGCLRAHCMGERLKARGLSEDAGLVKSLVLFEYVFFLLVQVEHGGGFKLRHLELLDGVLFWRLDGLLFDSAVLILAASLLLAEPTSFLRRPLRRPGALYLYLRGL